MKLFRFLTSSAVKDFYGRQKVALDRSRMWFGVFQFFFITILLLKDYQHTWVGNWVFTHQFYSMPIILGLIIVVSNVIKYIEMKLELRQAESKELGRYNPYLAEILEIVRNMDCEKQS